MHEYEAIFYCPKEIFYLTDHLMGDMAHKESYLNFIVSLDKNACTYYGAAKITSHETMGTVETHSN